MTHWIVNDLSLSGQYKDVKEFCSALDELLSARERNETVRGRLLCSTSLGVRPVVGTMLFRDAVMRHADHLLRQRVLRWIGKDGPFWVGDRAPNDDDLFWYEGIDVTDQGLGETTRRRLLRIDSNSFSFSGSQPPCDSPSLEVIQGFPAEPISRTQVPNTCVPESIVTGVVNSFGAPRNWHTAFDSLRLLFRRISFSSELEKFVEGQPFVSYVYERSIELLTVLDRLVASRDAHGQWTNESRYLITNHFQGAKAWFSDESEDNKRNFEKEMTFQDPDDSVNLLFCPWHGKIKSPQYRLHFEWPIRADQLRAKVVYIGPKITKK